MYLTYMQSISYKVQANIAIPVVWIQMEIYVLEISSNLNEITDNTILPIYGNILFAC